MNPEDYQQEAEAQQQVAQLEAMVKQKLSKEALLRYGTIKAADPEKALQLVTLLAQAIQQNNVPFIDDTAFKDLLSRLAPQRKEFKMTRR